MRSTRFGFGASVILLCGTGAYGFVGAGCSDSTGEEDERVGEVSQASLSSHGFGAGDGNTTPNDPNGVLDWDSPGSIPVTTQQDVPSGSTDNAFGNGTKEVTATPTVVIGGIPSNKSDLLDFKVASEVVGGKAFLYLAWRRANTSGSANIDFEFNQAKKISGNGVTPVRTPGDLLFMFDFGGSGTAQVSARTWSGTNWVTPPSPVVFEAGVSSDLRFGEAGINLTDSKLIPTQCETLGKAYVKSRSSSSASAELKDFIPPADVNVVLCQKLRLTVHKVDQLGNPLANAEFKLVGDMDNDGVVDTKTCTTDATGDCSVPIEVQGPPTGSRDFTWTETKAPVGFDMSGAPQVVTVKADGSTIPPVDIDGLSRVTFVNTIQTGTVTVQKVDDSGAPVGNVTFSITGTNFTCTTDSSGTCTMSDGTATAIPIGEYQVDETVDASSHYQKDTSFPKTIAVTPGQATVVTAMNPRKYRLITIVCQEGDTGSSLVSRDVTLNGTTLPSLASPPPGFNAADLCGLKGASFGFLPAGANASSLTPSVAIPALP